ncbi:MAG: hypothetical protein II117_07105 [Clostridia bacterium]|nr:hypothetical protein [Clostridia bacterium]
MRRFRLILFCLALLTFGCMQSKNIDEYAYVLNVGVERGTTMPYLVTFLVSVPGGTEEIKVTNEVISAEARSFSEAYETLNAAYPSRLSFSRASLLVIGEELARNGGQTTFLDFAFGKPDLWPNLRVVVAKEPLRDVFEGWVSDADPSLRKIKTAVGDLSQASGITADAGYGMYLEAISDDRFDAMLAYAGANEYGLREDLVGNEAYPYVGGSLLVDSLLSTSTAGSAVFDGDRMVGILDGRHTMEVLMVTDAFRRGELGFTAPDGQTLRVTVYRVRAPKIRLGNGTAEVELFLEADPFEPETVPMRSEELKAFLAEQLAAELNAVFSTIQSVNSDVMGFGRFAAKRFVRVSDWERYDWKSDYRTLSVTFSVTVTLSHNPHDPEME